MNLGNASGNLWWSLTSIKNTGLPFTWIEFTSLILSFSFSSGEMYNIILVNEFIINYFFDNIIQASSPAWSFRRDNNPVPSSHPPHNGLSKSCLTLKIHRFFYPRLWPGHFLNGLPTTRFIETPSCPDRREEHKNRGWLALYIHCVKSVWIAGDLSSGSYIFLNLLFGWRWVLCTEYTTMLSSIISKTIT